jgi:hypothetical protein
LGSGLIKFKIGIGLKTILLIGGFNLINKGRVTLFEQQKEIEKVKPHVVIGIYLFYTKELYQE